MFSPGERVVYAQNGVCEILGTEEKSSLSWAMSGGKNTRKTHAMTARIAR